MIAATCGSAPGACLKQTVKRMLPCILKVVSMMCLAPKRHTCSDTVCRSVREWVYREREKEKEREKERKRDGWIDRSIDR